MSYNNVFLVYNLSIGWNESVWYVVEQYGEWTEQNVGIQAGDGLPAVMHSLATIIDVQ